MAAASKAPAWKFHVFLSFRGEDTRNKFTDHLYAAFNGSGLAVFKDDRELQRGQVIASELPKAIEESLSSVVVLSPHYASSRWCLNELLKILESRTQFSRFVFPIFYDVDPSDVRHQRGSFAQAFAKHGERFGCESEKVRRWRQALTDVADLSGWTSRNWPETELIEEIVAEVWENLQPHLPSYYDELVGIDSRINNLYSLLRTGSEEVRFLGIWGMGGIGKTTLAKFVYKKIHKQFDISCFLDNVREVSSERDGLLCLQRKLLSHLKIRSMRIESLDQGKETIRNLLFNKKVLLVLDDLSSDIQLETLAGKQEWFGPGSRVIITTRDKHLLASLDVCENYDVQILNSEESLQLFCQKAFKGEKPEEAYVEWSKCVVQCAGGIPLALKVLGSFLCGRSASIWEDALKMLRQDLQNDVYKTLRISFDGLRDMEKAIFLDIACFFKGSTKDHVTQILKNCGLNPLIAIDVLIEKSLVTYDGWHLGMHDLLQEMGRNIVLQESPNDAGKRSRLWTLKDIDQVFRNNKGTESIQAIVLNLPEPYEACWNPGAFSKMSNLRLLMILNKLHLPLGLKSLPSGLKVLVWKEYPLESLPVGAQLDELVDLDMCHSKIKHLWRGTKFLGNLKTINLRNSKDLHITPDFTGIPNLEKLDLEGCINLVEVHASLGLLKKISYVTLEDCKNLKILPRKLVMDSLKRLILSGCSAVRKLPEFGENMKNLSMLALEETSIAELPSSVGHLTGLKNLLLAGCKSIVCLPKTISNLKSLIRLNISGCSKFSKLPDNLNENEALECLNVSETAIREVPPSIVFLKNLRLLLFRGCKGLSSNSHSSLFSLKKIFGPIPKRLVLPSFSGLYSLKKLDLSYCNLHDGSIPDDLGCLSSLVTLDLSGNNFVQLPAGCISKLLKLEKLLLKFCPNLQSFPKLPPNVHYVNASDCGSMKPLSDPRQIWGHLASFAFDKLQDAKQLKTLLVSPGNEIPSFFFYQKYFNQVQDIEYLKDNYIWADSTVSISMDLAELRHRYYRCEWWGILVCLVVEDVVSSPSQDYRIGWISKVPTINNFLHQLCHKLEHGFISGIPNHKYPHLLILYLPFCPSRWFYVKDKFQLIFFSSSLKSKLVIKKCGWRILCKENAESWRKKLSECNTASANLCIPRGVGLSPLFASWSWICHLKVPQRCKTFLLSVLCDRLPGNARCRFCILEGTIIHVLRDCRRAVAIWVQMVPADVRDEFFSMSLHDWMHRFLQKPWLPNNYRDYDADCLRFTITTWLLWKDRNSSIIEGNSPTDNNGLYSLIQSLVKEYAMFLHLNGEEGTSAVSSLSENSRLKHFIKLNVGSCFLGNPSIAGYGGLFRDVEGNWLSGFYGSLGVTTTVKAELHTICQGLITAWDLGYRNVLVETDSSEAIHLIEEANIEDHAYGDLLAGIHSLKQRNWSLNLIHSLREDNACADILAKLGAEQHKVYCFLADPPEQLRLALMADALNVQLPCL
ncbi:TMV resistance protein N-like [Abrus precatorius]|uniref:TMV resistance protein N-like n=1 Tax=Abrus precatorius TaxID=3816 RepID=A0A8B8L2F9_ABRPR|nr:TMV resistance protein N-like [Abrus precatorius]